MANPKIPTYPEEVLALVDDLQQVIDTPFRSAPAAYAVMSRLCVLYTPGALLEAQRAEVQKELNLWLDRFTSNW